MSYEFNLPDVGEGLTEGEIVKWHVKEGDLVKENQPLVNVLTDKAEVEIPSPKTGKITKLWAKEGEKVAVGAPIATFETADGSSGSSGGHGHHGNSSASHAGASASATASTPTAATRGGEATGTISATPAVRKLASDMHVDLSKVSGTGPGGRVTEEDVRKASGKGAPATAAAQHPRESGSAAPSRGPQERTPFSGIRRRTAEKMVQSARAIPHVTHVDEADCAALVALREELKPEAQKRNTKLSYLPFIMKALVKTLQAYPNFNASLDEEKQEIVRKKYYNIGMAVATDHGLFVPNIKDADKKDVWQLAAEIEKLAEKARSNKLEMPELQGGTFTITNIGPIGGLYATPIILHPEVAILGVMKLQERPVVREGKIVARPMLNLSLSFDHRVNDGAEAANFTNTLIKNLENPRQLL